MNNKKRSRFERFKCRTFYRMLDNIHYMSKKKNFSENNHLLKHIVNSLEAKYRGEEKMTKKKRKGGYYRITSSFLNFFFALFIKCAFLLSILLPNSLFSPSLFFSLLFSILFPFFHHLISKRQQQRQQQQQQYNSNKSYERFLQ